MDSKFFAFHHKMNNQTVNPETLRKRNSKKSETAEKRKSRLNRETELKRQKRAAENEEKRTERRKRDRERKAKKKAEESKENRNIRRPCLMFQCTLQTSHRT